MRNILLAVLLLINLYCNAQDVATDSKGKSVFTFNAIKKYRVDFSSKDFSLTVGSIPILTNYTLGNDPSVFKKSNFFIQPSLINVTDRLDLTSFKDLKIGGKLKSGWQTAVDSIDDSYKGFTFAAGAAFFISVDNFDYYSSRNSNFSHETPLSIGMEANLTIFTPIRWMVISLTGSVSNGWNDNTLLNYRKIEDAEINNDVVAFDKFEGKYGELIKGKNKARIAISVPLSFWYITIIPYSVVEPTSYAKPTYIVGLYSNILGKKLNFTKFQLPSTFGIGIDWNHKERWSTPTLFIRGSINIGEFD